MSYSLAPNIKSRFFITGTNKPLAGGLMYTYLVGTTTKAATYSDAAGTPNTNPIVLDSDGECNLYLDDAISYRIILENAAGVTQFDEDRIASINNAQLAAIAAGVASTAADRVQTGLDAVATAADRVQTASSRDAASVYASTAATAAKYYDTIALGLAGVADTVTFGVKAGGTDGLTRPTIYRRDSVSTYTLIMDQIAGTEFDTALPKTPVSVDGIIPFVQDADGRILIGQYLDGTPYPLEVDVEGRARITVVESATASIAPVPVSVDGIIPFVQDADDRILSGIYLDGTPYPAIVIPAINTAYDTILPADPRLLVSDYRTIVERSPQKLSFIRSITEAYNFKYCSPGTRVGFNTNSLSVKINVFYNFLVTRLDARNYVGVVLADGVEVATFTNPSTHTASATVETLVTFGSVATRKIEVIWPYGDGMELVNVKVVSGSTVTIASARPTNKLLLLGDSITHGFYASKVTASWAYLLCGLKSVQMISEGYGSLTTVGSYGTSAATGSGAYAVTVALGYNDFGAQTALATFQTAYQLILTNIRAALPSAKIYVITPIYSTSTNTIPLSSYRTYIGNAVTAVGDVNTVLIDGLTLMTNNSNRLADGIHPNDTGSAEIATALAALIT